MHIKNWPQFCDTSLFALLAAVVLDAVATAGSQAYMEGVMTSVQEAKQS